MSLLRAGAAAVDVTPTRSLFLFGYPHVERMSTGTNDPLMACALVLDNGGAKVAVCSVDVIFVTKAMTEEIRKIVTEATGILPDHILISATHTHSGPITEDMLSNKNDEEVPPADVAYVEELTEKITKAILEAHLNLREAELALTTVTARGVGGNRRDPEALTDPEVPVFVLREAESKSIFCAMTVYCMHPTVLHEDSTLYSGDFPGYTRIALQEAFGKDLVTLYHTGPEGNQSPRHFTTENTLAETERLGRLLAAPIIEAVKGLGDDDFRQELSLGGCHSTSDLPLREFPPVAEADAKLKASRERLDALQADGSDPRATRTAECDWFGATETATLARAVGTPEFEAVLKTILPAEIQVLRIGEAKIVALPGELFVEYSLRIKEMGGANTFVICCANGTLQGYIVTEEAFAEGGYEASNSFFPPEAGEDLIQAVKELLG
ncbi:MAG: neutral/alkaline non-lysosomal ceramidase N-terminal domain-containing protein [Planctomycetota bacterium]|jgi:hypothetical protein